MKKKGGKKDEKMSWLQSGSEGMGDVLPEVQQEPVRTPTISESQGTKVEIILIISTFVYPHFL